MKYLLMVFLTTQASSREISYVEDTFGYQATANCNFEYLNVQNEANTIFLTPSGSQVANDEGGGSLSLTEPFWFYNQAHNHLIVSSNGYLAFANSLSEENGGDFSNDCPFPSIPDNQPQSLQRIMPFHDDLESSKTGEIRSAYYINCPTTNSTGSCTVIEWLNWHIRGQNDVFSFQVILLHQTSEIKIQYTGSPPSDSASIGFQQTELFSGVVLSCNQENLSLDGQAYCYQNPLIFTNGFE